ncbi:peroxiredoxin family protein [Geomesophilobacter sediminis]|uniref:TlpA family protein disulfide reductase n=1 Tax=Geomesophilobacter sediminis TaxID=2798584 RepID=A0A8J7LXY5_9BACT|nr:TlpA disulfide reductase family protein [Geomesophilobacter sediminis]MBJ6723931.1 TlpA family protein disulfide reductase [Geomesophilobacter sediminis]
MKYWKITLQLVVLLAIGLYLFPLLRERVAFAGNRPATHQAAPNFTLSGLTGNRVDLGDYRGKVVLVNFFASWCPPCRMEIPGFQRTFAAYQRQGFTVIGLALDDVPPGFVQKMGMTYPLALATDHVIDAYGNVSSIPVSFLVGKDGRIIKKVMGLYSETSLRNDVERALSGRI